MGAMYEPQNNGPHTLLAATINDSQTSITVADATILPAAPNVLTIGTEEDAELVLVESKTGNILTVQRGFNGTTPKAWDAETWIYRAITAQDIQELQKRSGYIVYDLTSDELTALDTAARAALHADGARVLKVTNGETVVLLTLDADGNVKWAGGETPRNLLDNSDFTNPVNQRGQTSYAGDAYTIDRWQLTGGGATLDIADGYISLTSDTGNRYLTQKFDNPQRMLGKTFTIAAKMADGEILCASGTLDDAFPETGDTGIGIVLDTIGLRLRVYSAGYIRFELRANGGTNTMNCVWAALYEGAYTADTLPPYVPKGYSAELAECQRYYLEYTYVGAIGHVTSGAKNYHVFIPMPTLMRVVPSVADDFTIIARLSTGGYSALTPDATKYTVAKSDASTYRADMQSVLQIVFSLSTAVDQNNTIIEYTVENLKLSADL